jgi:hypothetical protein
MDKTSDIVKMENEAAARRCALSAACRLAAAEVSFGVSPETEAILARADLFLPWLCPPPPTGKPVAVTAAAHQETALTKLDRAGRDMLRLGARRYKQLRLALPESKWSEHMVVDWVNGHFQVEADGIYTALGKLTESQLQEFEAEVQQRVKATAGGKR